MKVFLHIPYEEGIGSHSEMGCTNSANDSSQGAQTQRHLERGKPVDPQPLARPRIPGSVDVDPASPPPHRELVDQIHSWLACQPPRSPAPHGLIELTPEKTNAEPSEQLETFYEEWSENALTNANLSRVAFGIRGRNYRRPLRLSRGTN